MAASLAALIAMVMGPGGEARAATATETGFAVPGDNHRGNRIALHAPSAAGMPATAADFLAVPGHGAATLGSLRVKGQMAVGDFGTTAVDLTQEVAGPAGYGVQVRAIFDDDGSLTTLSENVVSTGPVAPGATGPGAALDAALGEVHPGLDAGLTERGSSGNSTSFGGNDFFFKNPSVQYRPTEDWLLQAGIAYDTSPVSDGNRAAYLPMDRQIRYAVGAQYQWNERMNVGGAFEYINLGDARIDDPTILTGESKENRIFMIGFDFGYQF